LKIKLFILALLIRLFLAPISFHPWEFLVWVSVANDLISGVNPYSRFLELSSIVSSRIVEGPSWQLNFEYWAYPPFYLFFLFICGLTGLPSIDVLATSLIPSMSASLILKIPLILADLLIAFFLLKIACLLNLRSPEKVAYLWLFNPLTIFISSIWGHFDAIVVLLTVVSMFFLMKEKLGSSAISLALATTAKMYPILILPVFLLFIKKAKNVFRYVAIFTVTVFLICLPFLILDFEAFFEAVFLFHANRVGGGMTYWSIVWIMRDWFNLSIVWWGIPLSQSYFAITIFALVVAYVKVSQIHITPKILPILTAIPILLFLATSKLVNEPYALWALPFLFMSLNLGFLKEELCKVYYALPIAFAIINVPITNFFLFPLSLSALGLEALSFFALPIPIKVIPLFFIGTAFSIVCAFIVYRLAKSFL